MFYFPPLRRFVAAALIFLATVVFYKSSLRVPVTLPSIVHRQQVPSSEGIRISVASWRPHMLPYPNVSSNYLSPPKQYYYNDRKQARLGEEGNDAREWQRAQPILNPHIEVLFKCHRTPNQFTNHIRLPHIIRNMSMAPPSISIPEQRTFFNPTLISLPYWSENQYLLVTRVVPGENSMARNLLCEANLCSVNADDSTTEGEKACTDADLKVLGPAGGLRCATPPITLNVPSTPADLCEGASAGWVDYPGFHDPRVFWSGRGEPLMMVNSLSRYACLGLWLIDLRVLHKSLEKLLASSPDHPSMGPLMSYPTLTELTRNPGSDRSPIEKNWMLFFSSSESYVQYDISPSKGRAFAKLLGAGLTTANLTDPLELPCLPEDPTDKTLAGKWHQATNALRLVLCERRDAKCKPSDAKTVFFAVVHRKHNNAFQLPLRYERYFAVWSASPPFEMLAVSQYPILLANETAFGWSAEENWDDNPDALQVARGLWPRGFTYTVSIAYAWGRQHDEPIWKSTGYLEDSVVLGIGIDDVGQGFARAPSYRPGTIQHLHLTTETNMSTLPPSHSTILIVGAGIFGTSTAYHLAHTLLASSPPGTATVTLLDRAPPPSPRAASNDVNKIVRADYTIPFYMGLAYEAMDAWASWDVFRGETSRAVGAGTGGSDGDATDVYHRTGWVVLDEHGSDAASRIRRNFGDAHGGGGRGYDPCVEMSLDEVRGKWGGVLAGSDYAGYGSAYFNPEAGWADAGEALARMAESAVGKGVRYVVGEAVEVLLHAEAGGGVKGVRTGDERVFTADKVLLATGAWTSRLMSGLEERLGLSEEERVEGQITVAGFCVAHFELGREERERFGEMPVVAFGANGETFPPNRKGTMKFTNAHSFSNTMRTPEGRQITVPPDQDQKIVPKGLEEETLEMVKARIPELLENGRRPHSYRLCWDAVTPSQNQVISKHPNPRLSNLYFAVGGSGHSWKFLPIIGKYVSAVVDDVSLGEEKDRRWNWKTRAAWDERGVHEKVVPSRELNNLKSGNERRYDAKL
ncbi:MAG: hypothetical protein M1833_006335 [Piccolia ochrophora]|nr:MAG: hypothetical protein M1833_006335 [Piccolia ochrophora]